MKFERVERARALGHILGQNVSHGGKKLLAKGSILGGSEVAQLARAGIESVFVARLEYGDVHEDGAADRIALALTEGASQFSCKSAKRGRTTLRATAHGVLQIDSGALLNLNRLNGVTLAVKRQFSVARRSEPVATLKVIPFAIPEQGVVMAERIARAGLLTLRILEPRRVRIIGYGGAGRSGAVLQPYLSALRVRLEQLGTTDVVGQYVVLERDPEVHLAGVIASAAREKYGSRDPRW